jgi:hypothetical protein
LNAIGNSLLNLVSSNDKQAVEVYDDDEKAAELG